MPQNIIGKERPKRLVKTIAAQRQRGKKFKLRKLSSASKYPVPSIKYIPASFYTHLLPAFEVDIVISPTSTHTCRKREREEQTVKTKLESDTLDKNISQVAICAHAAGPSHHFWQTNKRHTASSITLQATQTI